ncbi:hypothetical protein KIW84_062621, partial [Lathyrus oleraceus]
MSTTSSMHLLLLSLVVLFPPSTPTRMILHSLVKKGPRKVMNSMMDLLNHLLKTTTNITTYMAFSITLCGHNFCMKCFEKWIKQGKNNCPNCRAEIPANMASDPQINSQLETTIQMAISESVAHGKIFVTISKDHFGPIVVENDPIRKRGVLVGDTWEGLMECIQWGAHYPHDSRIASQSVYG